MEVELDEVKTKTASLCGWLIRPLRGMSVARDNCGSEGIISVSYFGCPDRLSRAANFLLNQKVRGIEKGPG